MRAAAGVLAAAALAALGSCAADGAQPDGAGYSFFVAGHVYGKPSARTAGFHPPFEERLVPMAADAGWEFGVLLGDTVRHPTEKAWDAIDADIEALGLPVHLVPGNHDLVPPELVERYPGLVTRARWVERYGPTYRRFRRGDDHFLLLDGNLDGWNISGPQLEWLRGCLDDVDAGQRVFVMVHQCLWWDGDRSGELRPNSNMGRADEVNFHGVLAPLLRGTGAETWIFAGDFGALADSTTFVRDELEGLRLVGTGMGAGVGDNFLSVTVAPEGRVEIETIPLGR